MKTHFCHIFLKEFEEGRKRKQRTQHPSVAVGNSQREKENRERQDEAQRLFTQERSPYSQLSIPELKELIRTKTGKRTQKRSRESLLDILWNVDHGGNDQSSSKRSTVIINVAACRYNGVLLYFKLCSQADF